ncbi:sumo-1-activating enzyme E1a [Nesidiocoris tenuis]|uniref:SUMO-activating enzyme subunit 1 n=1 Tax=Nesidiocoris tenuis TaxID=355587 RepID=A0ABN7B6A0_9HEMI|nr:sumo-1-activating enzyme E1a [Nesidiocoris tenuis]
MVETSTQLTADEEKLYDRQIRLWGIESQKRLRTARLLLIGLSGLGAEVAKNIVLSGIKSITFLDDKPYTKELAFSQFLIPLEKIGENRAEASVERAQILNPLVEVSAETHKIAELTEDYFTSARWDVVIAIGQEEPQVKRLDAICRRNGLKFFAGEVSGMFGYFFTDLNTHSYTKTIKNRLKKDEVVEETVKSEMKFPSFESAVNQEFEKGSRKLRNLDPSYFALKILFKFREEKSRNPVSLEEDWDALDLLRNRILAKYDQPKERVPDEFLEALVGPEMGPVCAIVGSILSQELIKAISCQDEPHKNTFFFNPLNNKGTVVNLGTVADQ